MRVIRLRSPFAVLTVGALLSVAYLVVGADPAAETAVYETASLLGVAAVLAGLWTNCRQSWSCRAFAAGVVVYGAGDLVWCLHELLKVPLPVGHVADAIYLVAYPFFGAAVIGFSASHRGSLETLVRQLVDAALLFVAGLTAVWFFVIDPAIQRAHMPLTDTILAALYPTLDLAVLALVLRFALTSGRRSVSYRLLTCAFAMMFVGDLVWRLQLAAGTYNVDSATDTLFIGGYALWAAATLHPSIGGVGAARSDSESAASNAAWPRLTALAAAAAVPAIVLIFCGSRIDDNADLALFAVAITLLPLLSLVRVADMLRTLRQAAATARGARDDLDLIVASSPVPICVVDREGIVHVWNTAAELASGHLAADVIGGAPPVAPIEDVDNVMELYAQALAGARLERVAVKVRHREGHPIDVRVSTAPLHTADGRVVALFEDVTNELRQAREIAFLAIHDPLTGLANRRRFGEELRAATDDVSGDGPPTHVVLIDIDDFKSVNDAGGHFVGDQILCELADLLQDSLRDDDFIARLSGDEFALILTGLGEFDAVMIVERLLEVARDYRLETGNGVFDISLSAGICAVEPGDTSETALRRADEALYRAKQHGKNRVVRWSSEPVPVIGVARSWSPVIKDALREDRIDLHLQPIVALRNGGTVFYEALARLRLTGGDVIEAAEWILHAERLGLMPSIDRRMIDHARALLERDAEVGVFINLSASSFHDTDLLAHLDQALRSVPHGSLGIEITEHTTLTDPARTVGVLDHLQKLGALVAIDDFGRGFTSFAELATLPCDIVKIPGNFASDVPQGSDDTAAIASAITTVAHHYGKRVVIEGIESAGAARQAQLLGIEYAQGWHYGRPKPVHAFDTPVGLAR